MNPAYIVYNFQNDSSFIKKDREIISNHYKVLDFVFSPKKKILTPIYIIYQLAYMLVHWNNFQVILSQIAGYHTFIPSLLSSLKLKKHLIILHGTDSNSIPEISYGNLQKPILKWFTKYSILNATMLLPVSHSLIDNCTTFFLENNARFGLKNIIPNFQKPFQVIHNGLDVSQFHILKGQRQENSFLTVALDLNLDKNVKLKGIDLILELARLYPTLYFTILGSDIISNYDNSLPNVKVIGKVPHNELIKHYNQHEYYFQLSLSESFGMSLCEAMLCGCIPIVSHTGIMPEIIEDKGYILKKRDLNLLIKLIDSIILETNEKDPLEIRNLIVKKYDIKIREKLLADLIKKIT
jgi:glycosyltransferase involved in cell wall biosynthesis